MAGCTRTRCTPAVGSLVRITARPTGSVLISDDEMKAYADGILNGKSIRTRYTWSKITATSAHWEQALSSDAGKTWETNWYMDFTRM